MYNKPFKYIPSKNVFNTLKVSALSDDGAYTIGDSAIVIGTPEIRWENICFIENERLIWTHGAFYNEDEWTPFTDAEIEAMMPVDEEEQPEP